jgi:hypothetical protein
MAAWTGHGSIVAEEIIDVDQKIIRWQVGNFLVFVPVPVSAQLYEQRPDRGAGLQTQGTA